MMQITRTQLDLLCEIADAAGREIMDVYSGEIAAWNKDDQSPLTEADLRADKIIRTRLEAAFPDRFILSEESRSCSMAGQETFFLVDPLDGTKEFLKRNDEFTVNVALVDRGVVVAGVVLAPALNELFFAARGLGAWKRDARGAVSTLHVASAGQEQSLRVIGSRSHGGDALAAWLSRMPREHVFIPAGSSLKFCRIAEGRADIYPRFGPTSQWDTAAAQCVLETAGGAVTNLSGQTLCYGLELPILNPEFVAFGDAALKTLVSPSILQDRTSSQTSS